MPERERACSVIVARPLQTYVHCPTDVALRCRFVRRMGDTIASHEDSPARREALARDDFTIVVSSPDRQQPRAPPAQPRTAPAARSAAAPPTGQRGSAAGSGQPPAVRGRGSNILSRLTVTQPSKGVDARGASNGSNVPVQKRMLSTVTTAGGRQLSRAQHPAEERVGGQRGGAEAETQLGRKRDRAPRVRASEDVNSGGDRPARGRGLAVDRSSPAGDAASVRVRAQGRGGVRKEESPADLSALAPRKVARGGAKSDAPLELRKLTASGTQAEADAAALAREARFKRVAGDNTEAGAPASEQRSGGTAQADAAAKAREARFGGGAEADAAATARAERFAGRATEPAAPQPHKRKAPSPAAEVATAASEPSAAKQARSAPVRCLALPFHSVEDARMHTIGGLRRSVCGSFMSAGARTSPRMVMPALLTCADAYAFRGR